MLFLFITNVATIPPVNSQKFDGKRCGIGGNSSE